jgi:hypothetical protein
MNEIKPVRNERDSHQQRAAAELQPLTREMLDEQTLEMARTALLECATEETVTLEYGSRVLELRPLDTRLFVMHMSRFISMN